MSNEEKRTRISQAQVDEARQYLTERQVSRYLDAEAATRLNASLQQVQGMSGGDAIRLAEFVKAEADA